MREMVAQFSWYIFFILLFFILLSRVGDKVISDKEKEKIVCLGSYLLSVILVGLFIRVRVF